MELTLKVVSGKHAGQKLRIPTPKFLIGRGEDCHLRPNSDLVSRHHCILFVGASGAAVRDLNSRNGTFVNDERITADTPLRSGDVLKIGQLTFEVRLKAGETADAAQATATKGTVERTAVPEPAAPKAAKPSQPAKTAADQAIAARKTVDMGDKGNGEDDDVIEWFKEERTSAVMRDTVRIDALETTTIVADNLKQASEQSGEGSVLDDEKSPKEEVGAEFLGNPTPTDQRHSRSGDSDLEAVVQEPLTPAICS